MIAFAILCLIGFIVLVVWASLKISKVQLNSKAQSNYSSPSDAVRQLGYRTHKQPKRFSEFSSILDQYDDDLIAVVNMSVNSDGMKFDLTWFSGPKGGLLKRVEQVLTNDLSSHFSDSWGRDETYRVYITTKEWWEANKESITKRNVLK